MQERSERVDQDRGASESHQSRGASGPKTYGSVGPKGQKRAKIVLCSIVVLVFVYYFGNMFFYRTVDCTVVSAKAVSGGGGVRSSSSRQSIETETEECGLVLFTKMRNEGFDTAQDLADELNRHRGERLRFHVSYLYFGHYTARAVELEGHPITYQQ